MYDVKGRPIRPITVSRKERSSILSQAAKKAWRIRKAMKQARVKNQNTET